MVLVGLTVRGWFARAAISKLITELIEYTKDQKKMQAGLKDELARLQKALPKIQTVLNVVDQGLIRDENPPLEKWLWQLRDAADQADDVMDEIKYNYEKKRAEVEKNKVNKVITNFNNFFLRAVDKGPFFKRLEKAVKAIDVVVADVGEFYMLVQGLVNDKKEMITSAINCRETSSVLNVRTHVFGREKEKNYIIEKLLNPNCENTGMNFAVLPIIGVAGVGKTTLVQLVYNDSIVEEHFELRLWVCVSHNFDAVSLTKKLYESAFEKRAEFESFDLIQKELIKKFKSERFLIVFDDVWNDKNEHEWDKLIAPLKSGKGGSMIILTTRLKSVAKLIGPDVVDSINLESLNEHDMWDLFKNCAFRGEDPDYHKELVQIGREIVKNLKGSPLAIKTVGGILSSALNEVHWRSILENELWSLEQGENDIMPSLRLTYQYLPPHLKPCFSFCSIFPQDHVFHKHDLVNMWIALGMVPHSINGTKRSEDVGCKYFDEMLSRSIFLNYGNKDVQFVMHDLIHDLSVLVSQNECLRTSTNKLVHAPNTIRHLYTHIDDPCDLIHDLSGLRNLRTLILHFDKSDHSDHDSLVTKMLKGMMSLRVLILFAHNLSEVPESASKFLHLRYLRVDSSRISGFSKSVSRLYLLETMVYDEARDQSDRELKHADALVRLINLRHLNAPEWWLDKILGIGRLTSLQELSLSVGKDSAFKICQLSDMRELRSLKIGGVENIGSHEEVIQANLRTNVNLNKLGLTWTPIEPNTPHLNKDVLDHLEVVLDHLEPHSDLKELAISSYNGTGKPPNWFTTQTLSKLVRLQINGCNFDHLFCIEKLPLLKFIDFRALNTIERIIHDCTLSSSLDAFPSLEEIFFDGMRELKEWSLTMQPNKWMQCSRALHIRNCPNLQIMPPVSVGVKYLRLKFLGLNSLPNFWNDQSSKSALVVMQIVFCENLVSLNEGLLKNPEQFVALKELSISSCTKLTNLPPGGFSKFISLEELRIILCDGILVEEECFLPSALQRLSICSCGHNLDTILPKALESVHSLIELQLGGCENITSLPSKEVFRRWKTLKKLTIEGCPVLESLESLLGLSSIENLTVRSCPKLSSAQPQPPSTSSTVETRESSTQEKRLLSMGSVCLDDPLLLSIEPFRSLSSVGSLTVEECSKMRSLPELPPAVLQNLVLKNCSDELKREVQEIRSRLA